jgi:hypothetical protein
VATKVTGLADFRLSADGLGKSGAKLKCRSLSQTAPAGAKILNLSAQGA